MQTKLDERRTTPRGARAALALAVPFLASAACSAPPHDSPSNLAWASRGEPGAHVASALGTTYAVGPGKAYATVADVAERLAPGDVVVVDGDATYPAFSLTKSGTA